MNNTSVQTYILWEFCKAMNHIFFADFAGWLPPDMHASKGNPATRTSELEKENAELRAQLKTLQNVVDLLAGK